MGISDDCDYRDISRNLPAVTLSESSQKSFAFTHASAEAFKLNGEQLNVSTFLVEI